MIEFKGYISGAAEKAFFRKSRNILLKAYLFIFPTALSFVFLGGRLLQSDVFIYAICALLLIIPLLFLIPPSKKDRRAMLPKRIYTEDDYIVCIADQYTDSKFISDVKEVVDHGEFYELTFPFGKISEKFICQKSLLTNGTLAEFESLFVGKLKKVKDLEESVHFNSHKKKYR